jgi:hypothetical protein
MLKSQSREIGGTTYEVQTLSTEPGLRLFFQLAKLVGPATASALKQWQTKEMTPQMFAAGIAEFMSQLQYATFMDFVSTFQESTTVVGANGNKAKLSDMKAIAFAGDYGSLMKWLGFCLEVNFKSFFVDLGLTKPLADAGKA